MATASQVKIHDGRKQCVGFENTLGSETIGLDLLSSVQSQSLTEESEAGGESIRTEFCPV
jgi:hypothetical protein